MNSYPLESPSFLKAAVSPTTSTVPRPIRCSAASTRSPRRWPSSGRDCRVSTASLPGSLQPHRPTTSGRAGHRASIDAHSPSPSRPRSSPKQRRGRVGQDVHRVLPTGRRADRRVEADRHRGWLEKLVETPRLDLLPDPRLRDHQQRAAAADVAPEAIEVPCRPRAQRVDHHQHVGVGQVGVGQLGRADHLPAQAAYQHGEHAIGARGLAAVLVVNRLVPVEVAAVIDHDPSSRQLAADRRQDGRQGDQHGQYEAER